MICDCDYSTADRENEELRDLIVQGILESTTRTRLLREGAALTLDGAVKICRAAARVEAKSREIAKGVSSPREFVKDALQVGKIMQQPKRQSFVPKKKGSSGPKRVIQWC